MTDTSNHVDVTQETLTTSNSRRGRPANATKAAADDLPKYAPKLSGDSRVNLGRIGTLNEWGRAPLAAEVMRNAIKAAEDAANRSIASAFERAMAKVEMLPTDTKADDK